VLTVGINRAVDLLAAEGGGAGVVVGQHPKDGKPITLKKGRFGPYVQHGSLRATLKRGTDPAAVTLDEAVALLAEKAAKDPAPRKAAAKPSARKAGGRRKSAAD
jgi:DNA topoisomerase I